MTTTPPATPASPAGSARTIHLSELLRRPVTDNAGESLGRLSDVIVRLRGRRLPAGDRPGRRRRRARGLRAHRAGQLLRRRGAAADQRPAGPAALRAAPGEVLLSADVLGHRLIDVETARLVRAADVELERRNGELGGGRRWTPAAGRRGCSACVGRPAPRAREHAFRDWKAFEPLIGHTSSALLRGPFGRIRRLKPAQIADLLEDASKEEETEILGQVHADPELEADVFEELDEDRASRLLGARTDREIADVLTRMRADDAADAIAELPAAPPAAGARPAAGGRAHQGADADGLQPDQRGRPDGRRLPGGAAGCHGRGALGGRRPSQPCSRRR